MIHFASHYLPVGWATRVQLLGVFGKLTARIVDAIDVLSGKFFTRRPNDFSEISAAWGRVDHHQLRRRLATATTMCRQNQELTIKATERWAILTGEDLLPG